MRRRTTAATGLITALVLVAACSSGGGSSTTTGPFGVNATDTAPPAEIQQSADTATEAAVQKAVDGAHGGCDPLDTTRCLLPFPSDSYTVEDPVSPTHLRVQLPAGGMPVNAQGVAIDPTEWNRNDGFSPNTPILAYLPNLDAANSKLPGWNDIGASLAPDSTVVLVDVTTGKRIPFWAELDAHATKETDRLLTIRPAISLPEGHTFAIGMRGMLDHNRGYIQPSPTFRVYRDQLATKIESVEYRRGEMNTVLGALVKAGVNRIDLQLAWGFTVASTNSISGRMLHIRDDALAKLGAKSPAFTITSANKSTDSDVALQISGTFTVPDYLNGDGSPGNSFHYTSTDPDALPAQNGTLQVPFLCNVSTTTMQGTTPAHLVEYGHGLLGSRDEINAGNVRAFADTSNILFCATNWAGMSEDDIANAAATLADFSKFSSMADRLQQGVLNQIFLGRLMTRADGLPGVKTLHRADGGSLFDTAHLYFDGNSQGGIMGLMLTAVSPDIERSVLGVPGMNYSLLLPRSVDFAKYEAVFEPAYPNDLDRTLILGLAQMLWDRGEGAGYVQHVTSSPYEGTATKTVLLDVAYGDHQVTPLSALVEARTLGIPINRPVAAAGRWAEKEPGYGLQSLTYPSTGSGIIIWDSGADPMPVENLPPSTGRDPHEDPRADTDVQRQKASFLFAGTLIDVCNAGACTAAPHP